MVNRKCTPAMEDYLETIFALEKKNKVARIKDIAAAMNIKTGSVSGAIQTLKKKGFVEHETYGFISLTEKGEKIASEISRRHSIFKDFLSNILGLDEKTSETTACHMEHTVNKKVMNHLVNFIDYIRNCPRTGEKWIASFRECGSEKNIKSIGKCEECVSSINYNSCIKK